MRIFQFGLCFKSISQPNVQMSVKKQTEGVTTRQQSRSATRKKKKKNSPRGKKIKSPAESEPEKPNNQQKNTPFLPTSSS